MGFDSALPDEQNTGIWDGLAIDDDDGVVTLRADVTSARSRPPSAVACLTWPHHSLTPSEPLHSEPHGLLEPTIIPFSQSPRQKRASPPRSPSRPFGSSDAGRCSPTSQQSLGDSVAQSRAQYGADAGSSSQRPGVGHSTAQACGAIPSICAEASRSPPLLGSRRAQLRSLREPLHNHLPNHLKHDGASRGMRSNGRWTMRGATQPHSMHTLAVHAKRRPAHLSVAGTTSAQRSQGSPLMARSE